MMTMLSFECFAQIELQSFSFRPELIRDSQLPWSDYMAKLILSKCLTIFTVLGLSFATLVVASGNAGASSSYREGQDGNNLVCGGVHTLAKAIYIARGGSVKCANGTVERGIGKIWAAEGMTLQVIERMKVGTVCSNQGYLSSGREIGPDPSKNVRHEVAG